MTRSNTMMTMALIAVACIALSNARFLETTTTSTSTAPSMTPLPSNYPWNVSYASNLTCGQCIFGGYVFCVTGSDYQFVSAYPAATTTYCCRNASNCSYANNTAYTCSNVYSDSSYSTLTCPTSTTNCGSKQKVQFSAIGNTTNLTLTNLPAGQMCHIRVDATCGAPAFYTSNTSNIIVGYIFYEAQDVDLNGTLVTGVNSLDAGKKAAPPASNMPRRNQTFYQEDGYLPNPKIEKGLYNVQVGGVKAFGNSVQGSGALAYKFDSTRGACVANRTMLIAITAQSTVASMTLSLSSVNFTTSTLTTKPTDDGGNDGGEDDGSNAMTLSGFLSITLMSVLYMFY